MGKKFVVLLILLVSSIIAYGQTYKNWDSKNIDKFYEKVSVKNGTLSEDGSKISYVFVPCEIKQGVYEVRIVEYKKDLYEIQGTDYYVTFSFFVGYWGYVGKNGILEVGSASWSSKFYIQP